MRYVLNEEKAEVRGKTAMRVRQEEKMAHENKENAHIIARQFALEQEKIRAAQIARLPKPAENELDKLIEAKSTKMVTYQDFNAFTTTRYHMPETMVDKSNANEAIDARKEAIDEEERMKLIEKDQSRTNQERLEKARLRGKHALEKEQLNEVLTKY